MPWAGGRLLPGVSGGGGPGPDAGQPDLPGAHARAQRWFGKPAPLRATAVPPVHGDAGHLPRGGGLEHLRGGWPFICMWVRRGQCPRASSIAHGEDRSAEAPWSPSPRGDRPSCPDRLPRLASPDQPGHSRTRAVRCEFPPYRRVHECPSRRWVRGLRRSGEDSEEAQSRRARTAASSSRSATRQLAAVVSDEPSKPP